MSEGHGTVYLDSSIYLAVIKAELGRVDVSRRLLEGAQNGLYNIFASTLTVAEVCGNGAVRAAADVARVDQLVAGFFSNAFIKWVDVDLPLAQHARALSREHGLRGADAVHLASAIRAKCQYLTAWDQDFPAGEFIGGVCVVEPIRLAGWVELGPLGAFDE